MKTKPRSLTISEYNGEPRVILTGKWLSAFGFTIGDKINVTSIEPGHLDITVDTPAAIMQEIKTQAKLEQATHAAEEERKFYRPFRHDVA